MKVVILAGGLGTRLAEETEVRPKPMVEVGEKPIIWHIMKHYARYGFNEFVVALGYKGEVIKRFFLEHTALRGNFSVDLKTGKVVAGGEASEDWLVHLVDTGLESSTGGRIGRVRNYLGDEAFMLTYGDGVSNVNLDALLALHKKCGRTVTLTAVRPPARFGGLVFDGNSVISFIEKPQIGGGWINGGFMVMEPAIFDYIPSDATNLEAQVLEKLAMERQLAAYHHEDFWQCMDTLRDKKLLEALWQQGNAPWKTWT
ncbi:MAG TPA: glucose-1-phosphate cytidylyltransferase [Anaerolineales bacterium]|nr:glucose-1-phosphate cytidylyltransferase [Anaerolineales bacterium]HLO29615.1 glucose-1-phosphate cytidylyltransferase [Anaerolineales bacterium]